MAYYYIKEEIIESFLDVLIDREDNNKYRVYMQDIPIILKEYLNPTFYKESDKLYIEYKYFGYESIGYQRRQLYRKYISIEDELQPALNNYLGYPHKIIEVNIHNNPSYPRFSYLQLTCEKNTLVSHIKKLQNEIDILKSNNLVLQNRLKDQKDEKNMLKTNLSRIKKYTENIINNLDELNL